MPQREPGEYAQSGRKPIIVEFINTPEVGYLIANVDISYKLDLQSINQSPGAVP
jgi:hypothetical protein